MTDTTRQGADPMPGPMREQAVDPPADGHTHESACLNCGTRLLGSHCHRCGQAGHVHRTLGAFFHDLLHGVLHFEGAIWRTLPLLAWRPGELTRRYVAGERARFISPIALFLFTVFLTFALFNTLGSAMVIDPKVGPAVERELAGAQARSAEELARAESERAAAAAAGRPTVAIDARVAEARDKHRALGELRSGRELVTTAVLADPRSRAATDRINAAWQEAQANPALLVYKVQSNAYKYSWLLIPLSVPLVWLLFPFSRRFHLYDHTVFVTYSLSFMTLLLALASLASFANLGGLAAGLLLLAPVHMFRQLRGAYGLAPAAALWRTAALAFFAVAAILVFAAGLLLAATSH